MEAICKLFHFKWFQLQYRAEHINNWKNVKQSMVKTFVSEDLEVLITYFCGVHDLMSPVSNFLSFTIWPSLTFLLGFLTMMLAVLFFWVYFSLVTLTFDFHSTGNSDHVVSVFIGFIFSWKGNAPFHWTAFDYYNTGWDGFCDHIIEAPWKQNFNLLLLLLLLNFLDGISRR